MLFSCPLTVLDSMLLVGPVSYAQASDTERAAARRTARPVRGARRCIPRIWICTVHCTVGGAHASALASISSVLMTIKQALQLSFDIN